MRAGGLKMVDLGGFHPSAAGSTADGDSLREQRKKKKKKKKKIDER